MKASILFALTLQTVLAQTNCNNINVLNKNNPITNLCNGQNCDYSKQQFCLYSCCADGVCAETCQDPGYNSYKRAAYAMTALSLSLFITLCCVCCCRCCRKEKPIILPPRN